MRDIKMLRKIKGLTQKSVSEQLGISQVAYQKWEDGRTKLTPDKIEKLAAIFGVTADYILDGDTPAKVQRKNNIRLERIKKNMTQHYLAVTLNIAQTTLSKWESGEIVISDDNLQKVADALGVSVDVLTVRDQTVIEQVPLSVPGNVYRLPFTKQLPILGRIACGTPILADGNLEGYISVPADTNADFIVIAKGNSMLPRINDGDVICVHSQPDIEDGEIAAVQIDDEAVLKRVFRTDSTLTLVSENPAYPPLIYTADTIEEIRILGKAVCIISKL